MKLGSPANWSNVEAGVAGAEGFATGGGTVWVAPCNTAGGSSVAAEPVECDPARLLELRLIDLPFLFRSQYPTWVCKHLILHMGLDGGSAEKGAIVELQIR
jgi:hypothetical protein